MTEIECLRNIIDECDRKTAELFEKRTNAVKKIAEYKKNNNLPTEDKKREEELICKNSSYIKNSEYKDSYVDFLRNNIKISKNFQNKRNETDKKLFVKTENDGYNIFIEKGSLNNLKDKFNLNRKVLIVTDDGIPKEYINTVKSQIKEYFIYVLPQGEKSKNIENYLKINECLIKNNFSRADCIIALGGGVVGDLSGFVASTYMRGIDFYNIPTTVLSMVDSSVGGKTAIDFLGYKNIIGSFYQPKAVVIDTNVLKTLPERQISNGLAEALKMGVSINKDLFDILKNEDIKENIEKIILLSVKTKRDITEKDEKEQNLRKVLNFGHTIGHGIESTSTNLLHGECVALGILYFCGDEVKKEIIPVLKKLNLPTETDFDGENVFDAIIHDKKAYSDKISVIYTEKIGTCEIKEIEITRLKEILKEAK